MICDEHREWECEICFSKNPMWSVNPSEPRHILTPWTIKKYIQQLKTQAAVKAARRRRIHGLDQD